MRPRALFASALMFATGCGGSDAEPQRLSASGQLVASDGATPLAGHSVERYELDFVVAGETGDVSIARSFELDAGGAPIATDAGGWFRIASGDLALSYDWQRDELECVDTCVSWQTVCDQVTEEVCLDTCTELSCWDECSSECWDETFCDDYGCWTETVCDEVCTEVCDAIDYECNCYLETYDACTDECTETVEDCSWVTRTYTSPASLGDVISTEARIWLRDDKGEEHLVMGQALDAYQQRACDRQGRCTPANLWIQKDRFVAPFGR